ncbi:hypothetical protein U1Q18_029477 [Sarracenia purpurea var. burkii]
MIDELEQWFSARNHQNGDVHGKLDTSRLSLSPGYHGQSRPRCHPHRPDRPLLHQPPSSSTSITTRSDAIMSSTSITTTSDATDHSRCHSSLDLPLHRSIC